MSTSLGDLPKVAAADQGGLGAGGLRMSKSQSLSVSTPSLAGERRMDGSAGSLHRLQQSPDLFGLAGAKRRSGGSSGGIADGSGPDVPMLSAMLATDGATLAVAGASGEGGNAGSADFQDRRASGLSETGGPWHMSDSASIASTDVAVGVNRQPSPTGQGVVGVVGSRKVKKPPSVSHISTAPPSDSPEPKDKKDSAKLSNLSDLREENIFPEEIHLRTIFSVKDKAQSTLEQMIWAARCYEIAKTVWQLSPPPEKPPYGTMNGNLVRLHPRSSRLFLRARSKR
ncbi:hypothetical protein DFJ73DRAFT_828893 [Zopfochytrium polystomum]|nr:hypothetical protein DFJ73DRAFT_828893 [Zopfochytrium polystomum]